MTKRKNMTPAEKAAEHGKHPGRSWRFAATDPETQIANKGEFDELVVDHWLHIERMDERCWWMRVGDLELDISIAPDGTVTTKKRGK